MRAPAFWWSAKPGLFGRIMIAILTPLAALYGRAAARSMARPGSRINAPVICIGNFVAGGAGKTPTALAVADWLQRAGETPYFLSRGYGGALSADGGAHLVDQRRHGAAEAGDEPLLFARVAQTVVARDRPHRRHAGARRRRQPDRDGRRPAKPQPAPRLRLGGDRRRRRFRQWPPDSGGPLRAPLEAQLQALHARRW